jgi:hypothetical protein
MKLTQALFSATLIILLALAGLQHGVDVAWKLAIVTAALAFFTEQLRETAAHSQWAYYAGNALSLLSWVTGAIAGLALLIYA